MRESFATPETVPFWQLSSYIDLSENAGLAAAGYRLQYYQLLAQPFYLAAMVLLAAAVSLRFFRFGGVQKMVLCGIGGGFSLYVLTKVTGDLEQGRADAAALRRGLPALVGGLTGLHHAPVPGGRVMALPASPSIRLRRRRSAMRASPQCCAGGARRWRLARGAARARAAGFRQFPARPKPRAPGGPMQPRSAGANEQMLVRADEINYDYTNERVSAVGNVQIYYSAAPRSKPTGSSTTRRPSACTPKATSG